MKKTFAIIILTLSVLSVTSLGIRTLNIENNSVLLAGEEDWDFKG